MGQLGVVVIGGSDIVVAGLRALLSGDRTVHVLGSTTDASRGVELVYRLVPDVVLLEYRLADQDAREICERLVSADVPAGAVVVFGHEDECAVSSVFEAGASGFVHLRTPAPDLIRTVKESARGRTVLDPRLATYVMGEIRQRAVTRPASLSRREMEVMSMISRGASDAAIATELDVSRNTVRTYVRRSLDKLACQTRSEATAKLMRWSAGSTLEARSTPA